MAMSGVPLAALKGKGRSGEIKLHQITAPRVRTHDAHVVLQLLEEIHHLAAPGQELATDSPRLNAAAKLYLDTRDTFEVIEQKVEDHPPGKPKILRKLSKRSSISREIANADLGSLSATSSARTTPMNSPEQTPRSSRCIVPTEDEPSDGVIDRIQDMFRHLGAQLGPAILRELQNRKLGVQAILHYVRFLPAEYQWQAYKDARQEQVALAYRAPSPSESPRSEVLLLKQRAEFIKEHIRKDVDTVCLFSPDGTLSTIFGDDIKADKEFVADKFEALVTDIYSTYLGSIIDAQMAHLVALSDYWQQQLATARAVEPPFAQHFARMRKFRTKLNIFPRTMFTLEDRLAGLPPLAPGQVLKLLVADVQHRGLWWHKAVLSLTERDVSTTHSDESRGIAGRVESLDGHIYCPIVVDSSSDNVTSSPLSRQFWKSGVLAKWIGHTLLINNGKDSAWVEAVVQDVDDKKCKLALTKALQSCPDAASWTQLFALNDWVTIRDVRFMPVPLNPNFRVHVGQQFRDVLDVIQSVVVEISSIFPNDELNRKVGHALWHSVEAAVSKGEHLYARYLRSTLSQDVVPRRAHIGRTAARDRASSIIPTASVRNLVAAFEHSALGSSSISGSISSPAPGSPSAAVLPDARKASGEKLPGAGAAAGGYFDDHGRYHPQLTSRALAGASRAASTANSSGGAMSPFEKLSHHLLEETETIGVCLQAGNAALSRAFVQVLHEKLAKVLRTLETRFEREDTSSLECVLAEYANACRFLYVWRICRYELDTVPRSGRSKRASSSSNNMHLEWLDRTFERMDKMIVDMLDQLLHFAHRVFFHECASYVLPGIYEQAWSASKPWFANSRCSYSVQFVVARLHDVLSDVCDKVLPQYERTLGVHDKVHDLAVWMILDVLACLATSYETLAVSRARTVQWKIDVLYLVSGVHRLLRLLERMLTPRIGASDDRSKRRGETTHCSCPTSDIRMLCLRLLACVAIRTGPGDVVLNAVAAKVESGVFEQPLDATAELELHVNSIATSLERASPREASRHDETPDETSASWFAHSIFGAMELKQLGDVTLNWTALISRCSFPRRSLLAALAKRHELGTWDFPALSEQDQKVRDALQAFLRHTSSDERRDGSERSSPADDDDDSSGDSSSFARSPAATPAPAASAGTPALSPPLQEATTEGSEQHQEARLTSRLAEAGSDQALDAPEVVAASASPLVADAID